jgi:hypothetical protein
MLNLINLNDPKARQFMLDEIELDVRNGKLYLCSYFSSRGQADYLALIKEAARNYDDHWLADNLRIGGRMNATALRRKPKGGVTEVRVPITAPDTFGEGEFNRFYARAVCLMAIEAGIPTVQVYRAKSVMVPRSQSEAKIGTSIDAKALLEDLRAHQGMDTALGLPGPNSGLSVKLAVQASAAIGSVN